MVLICVPYRVFAKAPARRRMSVRGLPTATGFTPPRAGTAEMQGFADTRVDQSAQIYVDYEQVAPVARCRESRAVSPMNSSASVDHPPVGAQVRRRDSNPCNPHRVSS